MDHLKRKTRLYHLVILFFLSFCSCVNYKYVLKNDPQNPTTEVEKVYQEIKKGDWVTVVVNKRPHYNLEVQRIDDVKMVVRQYRTKEDWKEHTIYLEYVNKIVLQDLELTYPIGGPFTAVIVILFLLV